MPTYLVEVSQPERTAVKRVSDSVRTLGSHFATHADWRHKDGRTIGTLVVDAFDRRCAFRVVPPGLRSGARVFELEPSVESLGAGLRG